MRILAYEFRERTPPAELPLWRFGENPTDYGVHVWNARSVKEVGGDYTRRGNRLLLDIEHNKARPEDPAKPVPTAGYARLEIRAGVPWLVFDWSAIGVEQIRTGQRLYLSPDYKVDPVTGEITQLNRVSLVAEPGTHYARILATRGSMDPKTVKEALDALIAGDSEKCAEILKRSIADAAGAAAPALDAPVDAAVPAAEPPPADAPGAEPPKEEPQMTEKKDEPVSVAAAKPAATPAPKAPTAVDSAARLVAEFDAFKRDALLEKHGSRLAEPQRVWASKQSYDVVKGLIDSSPEPKPATEKVVTATRGAEQGTKAPAPKGEHTSILASAFGRSEAPSPIETKGNALIFRPMSREQARAFLAAKVK
jgi:hypothetical protein